MIADKKLPILPI